MTSATDTVVGHLPVSEQQRMIDLVRAVCELSPLVRPRTPNGTPMRVRVTAAGELGWVGKGTYHYSKTDACGRAWPTMPQSWMWAASEAAGVHNWDSAIINWYEPDASLGWHRDKSEHDKTQPIVTFSLGDAASWAIHRDEQSPITRCKLESGAITLLAGPTRNHLHTIERIIPTPLFSPLKTRGRISITIRVAGEKQWV